MKKLILTFLLSTSLMANMCPEVSDIKKYTEILKEKNVIRIVDSKYFKWMPAAGALVGTASYAAFREGVKITNAKHALMFRKMALQEFDINLDMGNKEAARQSLKKVMKYDDDLPKKLKLTSESGIKAMKRLGLQPSTRFVIATRDKSNAFKGLSKYKKTIKKTKGFVKKNKYAILAGLGFAGAFGVISHYSDRSNFLGEDLVSYPEDISIIQDNNKLVDICKKIKGNNDIKESVIEFRNDLQVLTELAMNKTPEEIAKLPLSVNNEFRGLSVDKKENAKTPYQIIINQKKNKIDQK